MVETATINGTELAYIEHGQGQPVVFVHGGVGDYRGWELQVPAFAASFRTIAVSCRGAWPNRKLELDEEITLDTFVEDLAAFVKELDLAPVHLVGHSSPGGFGGLLLAYRYPELLRSLVLLEPPAFPLLGVNIPPTPLPGAAAAGPQPAGRYRLHQVRREGSRPSHASLQPWRR